MHGKEVKIISGAQTGVDRGALDAALELNVPCGGTVPQGRLAEDGPVPERYPVTENDSRDYAARTEQNIIDADATLILAGPRLSGGTRYTRELALRHNKPVAVVNVDSDEAAAAVRRFIRIQKPEVLNVAGPRESKQPGIAERTKEILLAALKEPCR